MSYLETAQRTLAEIRRRRDAQEATAPRAGTVPTLTDEEVAAMTLDTFAKAGLVVEIRSDVLGRNVLFVSDDVHERALADLDLPVYRASELRKLAILPPTPRALRCIHGVKAVFGGAITEVREGRRSPGSAEPGRAP